ncbi:MAG: GNAT family N-acetyltransferase [Candidatus Hodarchaeota archaeon]
MSEPPSNTINTRDPEINEYYKEKAWIDMLNLNSLIYEYWKDEKVVGFSTASMSKLRESLEGPPMGRPSLLLGRLGVDQAYTSQSLGEELTHYIIGLARKLKQKVGCRLVILDVEKIQDEKSGELIENEKLISNYVKLGFDKAKHQRREVTILYFDLKNHPLL